MSPTNVLIVFDPAAPMVLPGIRRYLLLHPELKPHLHLVCTGDVREGMLLQNLIDEMKLRGVLACVYPNIRKQLENLSLPLVNIGDKIEVSVPTVIVDQYVMGKMAAEHLMEQGIRNFAFGGPKEDASYIKIRQKGFVETLAKAGHSCSLFADFMPKGDLLYGFRASHRWLAQLPKPTGIHTANTRTALRLAWTCQDLNLEVPADVALIGGADVYVSLLTTQWEPKITAFELSNWERAGYEGMHLLARLMAGEKRPAGPILIPPEAIIKRASTDLSLVSDPEIAAVHQWIQSHAHLPFGVKELVAEFKISRRTLERRFSQVVGHTIHDEIVRAHMERATTLLRQTDESMTQVASLSGFSSYYYFSVAFHRYAGLPPLEYRKKWLLVSGETR